MLELTQAEMQALDGDGSPARICDTVSGETRVLLRLDDFEWIRKLLGDEPDSPPRRDRRSGQEYVSLPLNRYERFKAFFEDDPLSAAERQEALRSAGLRAGWNAPVWNEEPTEPR